MLVHESYSSFQGYVEIKKFQFLKPLNPKSLVSLYNNTVESFM